MSEKKHARSRNELSRVEQRALSNAFDLIKNPAEIEDAIFQHSVLCQTFLPYRNPGDKSIWTHKQGNVNLAIQTTQILNPVTEEYEIAGLPYGPKARLILAYLNSEAVKTQQKIIDVENSMSAFIKKMGLNTDTNTIKQIKEQLKRITSSTISMGYAREGSAFQVDLKIVKAFELWFPKDSRQRVMWSSTIQLSDDYFNSLSEHAIPLDERVLIALSHNSMALDIYAWLAQRLHRIEHGKPQFVAWKNIQEQFGRNYKQMRKFKQVFRATLEQVKAQYPKARISEDNNKGYLLHSSEPPIPVKTFSIPNLKAIRQQGMR